ncbi:MAG: hypothetical protein ABIY70_06745 [Capsulimonas sp.]|uniref:hypothetical protein n=1 Tax=Capsulimonas sp. TaxID=2494211 RepID=UPI0032678142
MIKKAMIVAVLLTVGGSMLAQAPGFAAGGKGKGKAGEMKQLAKLSETLALTDDQKAKIKDIYKAEAPKMMAIRKNTALTPEEKKEQMKPIRKEMRTQIEALLTPEQKLKWAASRHDHKKKGVTAPA